MQQIEISEFSQKYQRDEFHPKSAENALGAIFPQVGEETKLQKARKVLHEVAKDEMDEQLQTFITESQYLIDSWLDDYERQLFDGLTLKQILKG